jgi:hypothetical protein
MQVRGASRVVIDQSYTRGSDTGGTRHVPFAVRLDRRPGEVVVRFARPGVQNVFRTEIENYVLIRDLCDVQVPVIHAIDSTCRIAPTAYMVMQYMGGKPFAWWTDPLNPESTSAQKAAFGREFGRIFARAHAWRRNARDPEAFRRLQLALFGALEQAVRDRELSADRSTLARAREVFETHPGLREPTDVFCLLDIECYAFCPDLSTHRPYVLDVEWARFSGRARDLFGKAVETNVWQLEEPMEIRPEKARSQPFFQGYCEVHTVDFDALADIAPLLQLSMWCNLLDERAYTPNLLAWIREHKAGLLDSLIRYVAGKAGRGRAPAGR